MWRGRLSRTIIVRYIYQGLSRVFTLCPRRERWTGDDNHRPLFFHKSIQYTQYLIAEMIKRVMYHYVYHIRYPNDYIDTYNFI